MLALGAVAALALVAAPAATAKEISKAEVCGPDACTTVDDHSALAVIAQGGPPREPPVAASYYEVRLTVTEGDEEFHWGFTAVPGAGAARADDGTWMEMPAEATALVEKYAGSQKPFPAAALVGAAPPPDPRPSPAADPDSGSLLWPEGIVIALALAAGGILLVRMLRRSGGFRPASG